MEQLLLRNLNVPSLILGKDANGNSAKNDTFTISNDNATLNEEIAQNNSTGDMDLES